MEQGIILFCDGGSRNNTSQGGAGWGGSGVHGYLYKRGETKKGAGMADWLVTLDGYVQKKHVKDGREVEEVEPLEYIDGVVSYPDLVTNNYTELYAAINGLRYAQQYEVKKILIFSDSRYLIDGMNEYLETWKSLGWKKRNGGDIANPEVWKELSSLRDEVLNNGLELEWRWVKGHDDEEGSIGNEIADRYATIGVMYSKMGSVVSEFTSTPAQGYWKNDIDKNKLICHRRLYFNTASDANIPGEYYLGEHGSDDELLGKRKSDGCYAVVRLKEPDPVIESVIGYAVAKAGNLDNIMAVRLDNLYRIDTYQDIRRHQHAAFIQPSSNDLSTICLDEQPLTKEFSRPMLAMRSVEILDSLANKLDLYLKKDASITVTDLTPIFYTSETKVKKKEEVVEYLLKPEFGVGFSDISLQANYNDGFNGLRQDKVILCMGIDIPHRNALKQMESTQPKISLITWSEEVNTFRYATVVENDGDVGIYAGWYSNYRLVASPKPV